MTRPTDRTGPAPTDQTIAAALKTWPGGPPTRNRVMAEYGIGATRATRLLDETIPDWRDRAAASTGPALPAPLPTERSADSAPDQSDEVFAEIVRDFTADTTPADRTKAAPVQQPELGRRQPRIWGLLAMLYIIAASAGIAIWSGWVGLGGMSGYGPVHPLPGISDRFVINAAIGLPLGMEAFAAIALKVWIAGSHSDRTRNYAKRSTIVSLCVGSAGQVAYHLLVAFHASSAPWLIVTGVAVLPVAVLGMAAGLAHLVIADRQHVD